MAFVSKTNHLKFSAYIIHLNCTFNKNKIKLKKKHFQSYNAIYPAL